jgi:hypothetical protein
MAEQHGTGHHHESVPQEFLHLVGYRDPHAGKAPPRPTPKKP